MKYREDIDGLRALAVVPVILYHAGFELFSGGFVGVDVFFVISGYLITTIIINDMESGKFSLVHFYERRARRILPALFIVLLATYTFSWFYLLPNAHKVVGQYVVSVLAFSSNVLLYLKDTDYFGLKASENPLLHTWSLAVEEQFYILFPLFLMAMSRFGKKALLFTLSALSLISLVGTHWYHYSNPVASFFLLPFRAWEILIGAICALYLNIYSDLTDSLSNNTTLRGVHGITSDTLISYRAKIRGTSVLKESGARRKFEGIVGPRRDLTTTLGGMYRNRLVLSNFASFLGLALIIMALFIYDGSTPTSSLYLLLPTLGTVLIITFTTPKTFTYTFLSQRLLVKIGLISYSAYLWHQPILVFGESFYNQEHAEYKQYILIFLTFSLAYITWSTIECFFRKKTNFSTQNFFTISSVTGFALFSVGVMGHLNNGFVERNPLFTRLQNNVGFGMQCNGNYSFTPSCSSSNNPKVVALGNSYMMQFVEALSKKYDDQGVLQLTQDGCEVGFDDDHYDMNAIPCPTFYRNALKAIKGMDEVQLVVISSPFSEVLEPSDRSSLLDLVGEIEDMGISVLFIGPTPDAPFHVGECLANKHSAWLYSSKVDCSFAVDQLHFDKIETLKALVADLTATSLVDITSAICHGEICNMEPTGDILMYTDKGHLSKEGAEYVLAQMDKELPELID